MVSAVPRLRRYARALAGDHAAADDLVQDTLQRAWTRIDTWQHGADMRAWLFSILHNLHVDQRRRPGLTTVALDDEALELPVRASQTDGLDMRDLETALQQILPEQREVLLLVALEDMSYEEIARTLGVPLGTVMSRLSRGRSRLRGVMEGRIQPRILKVVK
ncbi:RNA polymerase sigma factor [Limnobacter sp. P1]|uniref:RNA polymerase sigma factor n=1 Tax=Limnobacter olei TaxID=3031298 RepID=UPI0023AEF724|nr:sigma-70 family RNA polymerase sigma factor [Limnobacter sp. P1]